VVGQVSQAELFAAVIEARRKLRERGLIPVSVVVPSGTRVPVGLRGRLFGMTVYRMDVDRVFAQGRWPS